MKISVFYSHLRDAAAQQHCSAEEVLVRAVQAGITGVELDLNDCADRASLKQQLAACGLSVSNICCSFDFPRSLGESRMDALVETALFFGAGRIMPIPGFYPEGSQDGFKEPVNDTVHTACLEGLRLLSQKAVSQGLQVSMEDFDNPRSPIATSEGMKYFADRIPGLGYTFDTGNFSFSGESLETAYDVLREKIIHVHCKDRSRVSLRGEPPVMSPDGRALYPCAFGSGFLPTEPVVRKLLSSGYQGWFTIEHFGSADYLADLQQSAACLLHIGG